jgi:hypothetical protein
VVANCAQPFFQKVWKKGTLMMFGGSKVPHNDSHLMMMFNTDPTSRNLCQVRRLGFDV